MENSKFNGRIERVDLSADLYEYSSELRALAYLFETQGSKANEISEIEMDQISHGLGKIMKRLSKKIRQVACKLDKG